jgi:hypothetical protein
MQEANIGVVGGLIFLTLRSLLLWLLVPLGFASWLFVFQWTMSKKTNLGQWLGWLDGNLSIFLVRVVIRPFVKGDLPNYIWWADIAEVEHRIDDL